MIGADVSNAQYLFACKMTEEKISKNVTDIRSVATLANRIKEPRLLRMYKRESELFDELAISSRKALKSLSALQRDSEKLNDAEEALKKEIEDKYEANTNSARENKIFGSPSFVVKNEVFWGDDRMEDAIKWNSK